MLTEEFVRPKEQNIAATLGGYMFKIPFFLILRFLASVIVDGEESSTDKSV